MRVYLFNLAKAVQQDDAFFAHGPDWTDAHKIDDPHQKARFLHARSFRRSVLAQHFDMEAQSLAFGSSNGKPYLIGATGAFFSTSYSEEMMAIACSQKAVGVDLEKMEPDPADENVIEVLFHPNEKRGIEGLTGHQRTTGFYKIWTQKEAFAKAIGEGIGIEFSQFEVPQSGGLVAVEMKLSQNQSWYTQTAIVLDRYALAVAASDPISKIDIVEWPMGTQ